MKNAWIALALACLGISGSAMAQTGVVGYTLDISTTFLASPVCDTSGAICANPSTGLLTVFNNGASTFSGTVTLSGGSPVAGDGNCPDQGTASDSFSGSLAPGGYVILTLAPDSSACGGWNDPSGAQLEMNGTVSTDAGSESVDLIVNDSSIHSGSPTLSPCDGVSTDAFILNGGSPTGCDNNQDYKAALGPGLFEFFEAPPPPPAQSTR